MVGFSIFMMYSALVLIGAILWFSDAFTPNLPPAFLASDIVWVLSLLCLFSFKRYPSVTVASAWTLFIALMVLAWSFQPSHTLAALICNNGIQLTYLGFAHVGWLLKRKTRPR